MSYRHPYLCCLCLLSGCLTCQTAAGTPTEDGKGTHQACLQHSQFHNEARDDNPSLFPFPELPWRGTQWGGCDFNAGLSYWAHCLIQWNQTLLQPSWRGGSSKAEQNSSSWQIRKQKEQQEVDRDNMPSKTHPRGLLPLERLHLPEFPEFSKIASHQGTFKTKAHSKHSWFRPQHPVKDTKGQGISKCKIHSVLLWQYPWLSFVYWDRVCVASLGLASNAPRRQGWPWIPIPFDSSSQVLDYRQIATMATSSPQSFNHLNIIQKS